MLGIYRLAMWPLRKMPAHEYEQAVRAPIWFVVVIGLGITLLALYTLGRLPAEGEQFFIGWPRLGPVLLADAYTLWGSALLGVTLAATAWVPAVRRGIATHSWALSLVMLSLTWIALLTLHGLRPQLLLLGWLALLGGVLGLWTWLFRPHWRWRQVEPLVLLAVIGLLGVLGIAWLNALGQQADLTALWSSLLSASPRATSGATVLLVLGWLGPAAYLPWWLWTRRDDQAARWLPAALLLAVTGMLVLVRVLVFAFPTADPQFLQATGLEQLFLIRRALDWMLIWGLLALWVGTAWLAYTALLRQALALALLRPLVLVAVALVLLALTAALRTQTADALHGLLWMVFTWLGFIAVWLGAGGVLPLLTPREQGERSVLIAAVVLALAALVAIPPTAGFLAVSRLWQAWGAIGAPRALMVTALVICGVSAAVQLPRWSRQQEAATVHPGTGWGILAPFGIAFALLASGILYGRLGPLLDLVQRSLRQNF
jgi:hypothetical protein